MVSAKFAQPSLKPSLLGPLPILRDESISVIYSVVNFALDENELPESHSHSKRQFTADKYKESEIVDREFHRCFPY